MLTVLGVSKTRFLHACKNSDYHAADLDRYADPRLAAASARPTATWPALDAAYVQTVVDMVSSKTLLWGAAPELHTAASTSSSR